jgi:hypothetical protein
VNTCYSPTPNRDPHIGHAWIAFLNWWAARRSGGEFVVLWDDLSYANGQCEQSGYSLETGILRTREQLTWLGMAPDREGYWSDHAEAGREAAARLGYRVPRVVGLAPTMHGTCQTMPEDPAAYSALYEPALMALWVVGEARERIDGYYTGTDFLGCAALYEDICRRLGLRPPLRSHVPAVRRETLPEKESKSRGAVSIADLREAGFEPWQFISTLRECDLRSRHKHLADTVIPAGLLEADPEGWLTYRGDVEAALSCLTCYGDHDCGPELRRYFREVTATNGDRQRALMQE